jgi:zinc transport system ATP-binding protein
MNDTILKIQDLVVGFPGRPLHEPLNLDLPAGSRLGVIGGNGSGKSTLMKTLMGLNNPYRGSFRWQKKARFGYVPQENQVDLLFPMTVGDLLNMGMLEELPRWRRSKPSSEAKLREILNEMEIAPLRETLLRELSGGERQRSLIGRAWISKPSVLLMDEPFNSLDYRFKEKLWKIFGEWRRKHPLTLILIDHDLNRVLNQVDYLAVLGPEGSLCGSVSEVVQAEPLSRAYGAPLHVHRENGLFQVHFL